MIQSSSKDADYLEHRINEFLTTRLENFDPTEAELETVKAATVNKLKQKRTNLGTESMFNWAEVASEEWNFDSDLKKIEAIQNVTKERLMATFREIFFDNPRRFNTKIHSHAKRDDIETR